MSASRRKFLFGLGASALSVTVPLPELPALPVKAATLPPHDFDWRQKTPEEILADIEGMLKKLMTQSPFPQEIQYTAIFPEPVRFIDAIIPLDERPVLMFDRTLKRDQT